MSFDLIASAYSNYLEELRNTPLWKLPVAGIDATARAATRTAADWLYAPPPPTTPQGRFSPAAPRSEAELVSGRWTPENAFEFGQRETVQEVIRENAARANGLYIPDTAPPPEEEDNTILWILGAVAVTGIGIAVLRR